MTPIDRLIFMYGNSTKAARALGLKNRQVVENWVKYGYIPYKCAHLVEKATGGTITRRQCWLAADEARGVDK